MVSIRRFAEHLKFKRPIEMELGPDGCLYLIEFGTGRERNKDSQIVQIEYGDEPSDQADSRPRKL